MVAWHHHWCLSSVRTGVYWKVFTQRWYHSSSAKFIYHIGWVLHWWMFNFCLFWILGIFWAAVVVRGHHQDSGGRTIRRFQTTYYSVRWVVSHWNRHSSTLDGCGATWKHSATGYFWPKQCVFLTFPCAAFLQYCVSSARLLAIVFLWSYARYMTSQILEGFLFWT